ncbi:hypothetical protein TVAG_100460 [Trichomonas vaginalis G3]|uniref:Uncharacterized protein n=1 Tax=Trichomonas vaginalis (strain ATCC PRA-98 / G3) TaxID=412133 RepID=A2ENM3_TRIV3|nr:hypothetical protein TVAGG3_0408230 [Trichomonas vaginalis G3]EAY05723.1 hypothetical protein TVAG_100460 [Trichomonas vaginalis G3]KAI5535168.1 hypothetical protein TVAGG3_0408230 [Trichomonas vaginalis G3]|eukprot:XP_001317946.1 hypothetical protein [Trichomonas vaginalis G3]
MFRNAKKKVAIPTNMLFNQTDLDKGTHVLGISYNGSKILIIRQVKYETCSEFRLIIREIDCFNFKMSVDIESHLLFSANGLLNYIKFGMHFILLEILDSTIEYIVIGYMPDESNIFVYFSVILRNKKIINFSFPTNSNVFDWDPNTSLIVNKDSGFIIVSAVSSLKIICFDQEWNPKFKSIDIDKYISRILGDSTMLLEAYISKIITNIDGCFYTFIGFVYYSESKQSWMLMSHILKISNDGKTTLFNSTAKSLTKRPRGEKITKKLDDLYNMHLFMSKPECLNNQIISHNNYDYKNGIRSMMIPTAECCLIDIKKKQKNYDLIF